MVHPCKAGQPNNDKIAMHACAFEGSKWTICGREVVEGSVGVAAGYDRVCRVCFPQKAGTADNERDIDPSV